MNFRRIEILLVDSKLFISLCAALFYWTGYMILSENLTAPPIPTILIVFLSALWVYRISRGNLPGALFRSFSLLIGLSIIILSAFWLSLSQILFLAHLGLVSVLYYFPAGAKRKGIRGIPYLKIFIVAYVWAAVSSFLPSLELGQYAWSEKPILLFLAHFCFITAILIPFDIRDMQSDQKDHTLTLPQAMGSTLVKITGVLLMIIFTALILALTTDFYLTLILFGATVLLILKSEQRKPRYYFGLLVDGLLVLYFIAEIIHLLL